MGGADPGGERGAVRYGPTNKRGTGAAGDLTAKRLFLDPCEQVGGVGGVVPGERVKLPLTGGGDSCY